MNNKWQKVKVSPYITILLVAINAIIFLLCTFIGDLLYNIGGLSPHSFFDLQQYYRVVSAMFLHADINHIINNMLLLAGLGVMLEGEMHHFRFLLLYFLSGLGGQVVSLVYKGLSNEWYVSSIGASGAVFGLVGVLLAMSLCWKRKIATVTWQRILIVVAYSIYSGIRASNIDNAAHIGGFMSGFVLGLIMCLIERIYINRRNRQPIWRVKR
ncbi:MAG TPA: rhomboid family intramembrane serine protease [Lachnospiraceae bacterium]|nr:rhomboid family intramembrane serine protease [Lachnospiraceae bacterium]